MYRNGANTETYFGIAYYSYQNRRDDTFYPDFLVKYQNGSLGIYDTKKGITVQSDDTAEKSDGLQAYIAKNSRKKLTGGIIDVRSAGFFEYTGKKYDKNPTNKNWKRFVV